jgi:hypothetical protein
MKLKDVIKPNINNARSVNIDRDYNQCNTIADYQITAKTLELLDRFVTALEGEKTNCWSLTGPYGMGKSAFVNYLLALTGPEDNDQTKLALKKLSKEDATLHKRFIDSAFTYDRHSFLRIPVTSAYEPVNNSIARGILFMLDNTDVKGKRAYKKRVGQLFENKQVSSAGLFELLTDIQKTSNKTLLIVIDEFGKNLDYMSHHHDSGDIFILQQLAEMSTVFLWVCLHQAFDEYAAGLSTMQRKEWSKVQGRFEDIAFVESTKQMLHLLEETLTHDFQEQDKDRLSLWGNQVLESMQNLNIAAKGQVDQDLIKRIYPIHPLTALALVSICTRFAQNDRTLLSFACSGERFALPAYLEQTEFPDHGMLPSVGLDYLYDYFFNVNTAAYNNKAETQRWVEINNIISSSGQCSEEEMMILKSIGLLNLLSGAIDIKANADIIALIVEQTVGIKKESIFKSIKKLTENGSLLYRAYSEEYRLWEGSDFDVYKEIMEQKEKLNIGALEDILGAYLPLTPVIASRHAYQTGTVRKYERRWLPQGAITDEIKAAAGYDGVFVYSFGNSNKLIDLPSKCVDGRPLIIAYMPTQTILRELALEVAAARKLLEDAPQLVYDSVARKEVKFRIKVAEESFREYLSQAYEPGAQQLQWYANGRSIVISNAKQLSIMLSDLFDECYHKCPPIRNEMINYNNISAAAAKARRQLVEALFISPTEKDLGLTGYGPEVAVYRSLLTFEGLHRKEKGKDNYCISLDGNNIRLKYLWGHIEDSLNNAGDSGLVLQDLVDSFKEPPFGLKEGPIPIYFSLYLLAKADEIAIFREGTYKPVINDAEAALMVKRPDLFTLKKYVFSNKETEVFSVYLRLIESAKIEETGSLRNANLLNVVGPLIKFIGKLPAFALNTKQITQEAIQVRLAIQNSVDPAALIFQELPKAVGFTEIYSDSANSRLAFENQLKAVLLELDSAYPNLYRRVQGMLLEHFGYDNIETLYSAITKKTKTLFSMCDDVELKPFLMALSREYPDPVKWVEGVAGIVIGKPMGSWYDNDIRGFEVKLYDYIDRMKSLETIANMKNKEQLPHLRLFSITMPNGSIKREVFINEEKDQEVEARVSEILKMPKSKAKALLINLAEKLMEVE